MSWNVNVPSGLAATLGGLPAAEFADAVRAAKIEDTYNAAELVKQWEDQLEMAKEAALKLFEQLARVEDDAAFNASMIGHANRDGAGDAGNYTTAEFIHVSVHRQPPSKS